MQARALLNQSQTSSGWETRITASLWKARRPPGKRAWHCVSFYEGGRLVAASGIPRMLTKPSGVELQALRRRVRFIPGSGSFRFIPGPVHPRFRFIPVHSGSGSSQVQVHSGSGSFRFIPGPVHSGSFQVRFIPVHSGSGSFWFIPGPVHSSSFQVRFIPVHSRSGLFQLIPGPVHSVHSGSS